MVEVNASPGRMVTALVGGETTAKYVWPAVIFTAVSEQSASPRFETVMSRCALWPFTTWPNESVDEAASSRQVGGYFACPRSGTNWSGCPSLGTSSAPWACEPSCGLKRMVTETLAPGASGCGPGRAEAAVNAGDE